MPNLGDFIGHLLSEITIARMQADVETIRIAELYASNPLLAKLPVPHFRMPDIEIDVPVVIQKMEEPAAGTSGRGTPPMQEMHDKFNEILGKFLKDEMIELNPAQKRKLEASIERKYKELPGDEVGVSKIAMVADTLADVVSTILTDTGGPSDKSKRENLKETLKNSARVEFLKMSKPPARLKTLVTTAEIKEAGPGDVITRLHLKVNEESFEWTSIESEGKKTDRLVPE